MISCASDPWAPAWCSVRSSSLSSNYFSSMYSSSYSSSLSLCAVFRIIITAVTTDITLFIVAKIKVSHIGWRGEHSVSQLPQQHRYHPMVSSFPPIHCPCPPSYFSYYPSSSHTSSQRRQLQNSQRRPHSYNNPISCVSTPPPPSAPQFWWHSDPTQQELYINIWIGIVLPLWVEDRLLQEGELKVPLFLWGRGWGHKCLVGKWREGVVVHSGYYGWWRGGGWFVIVFYGMFYQKIRWGQNAGCQCVYIKY